MSPLPYRFHPAAEAEFFAEIDWYAARDAGVATDFAAVVRDDAAVPSSCRSGTPPDLSGT